MELAAFQVTEEPLFFYELCPGFAKSEEKPYILSCNNGNKLNGVKWGSLQI